MTNTRSACSETDGNKIWSTIVTVVDQEEFDSGPFVFGEIYTDGSLTDVMESLATICESIPEQYRSTARCQIDSTGGYEGSHYPHILVTYERPETPEETAAREDQHSRAAALDEAKAREQYERLKYRFDP